MTRIPMPQFQRLLTRTSLTDQEIAQSVGVATSTVARWRHGRSTPSIGHVRETTEVVEARAREDVKRAKRVWKKIGLYKKITELDNGTGG